VDGRGPAMKKFLGKRKLETVMRNISFTFYAGLALILAFGSPVLADPGLDWVPLAPLQFSI
jgi:hypothetical protein